MSTFRFLLGTATGLALCVGVGQCYAYKQATHRILSITAIDASEVSSAATDFYSLIGLSFADAQSAISNGANNEDNGNRAFNHFFDPSHGGSALQVGITLGNPSPDWILAGIGQPCPGPDCHSYNGIAALYLNALTAPNVTSRQNAARQVFTDLGHVVHHVQDMAQPQHTRNDDHCDSILCALPDVLLGTTFYKASAYEAFADSRRATYRTFAPTRVYSSVADNGFASARDFWQKTTGPLLGLAVYSNQAVITVGTNFENCAVSDPFANSRGYCATRKYALPRASDTTLSAIDLSTFGEPSDIETHVTLTPSQPIAQLGAFSNIITGNTFSVNRLDYLTSISLLVPRAIGYSAGLLNFFFRGKVDAKLDPTGKIMINNLSSGRLVGKFTLFYDAINGNRDRKAAAVLLTGEIPSNGSAFSTVSVPSFPDADGTGQFILVFDGNFVAPNGSVDRIVAGKKVVLAPSSLVITNAVCNLLVFHPELGGYSDYIYRFSGTATGPVGASPVVSARSYNNGRYSMACDSWTGRFDQNRTCQRANSDPATTNFTGTDVVSFFPRSSSALTGVAGDLLKVAADGNYTFLARSALFPATCP